VIRVLAVDPGERVGWATATIWPESGNRGSAHVDTLPPPGPLPQLKVVDHGIAFLKDAATQIYNAVVVEDRIDVVIYETWILTRRGAQISVGSDMQSSQFVGMVRLAAWLNPRVQLVAQGPKEMRSATKSLRCGHPSAGDVAERIRKLPKSHDESHDGSALLHLWHYFFERYV
jgi:hypothetical protein